MTIRPDEASRRGFSAARTAHCVAVSQPPSPAVALAVVGVLILAFLVCVLGRWIVGPNFVSTPTGDGPTRKGRRHC